MLRKTQHAVFVEEEDYNWATPRIVRYKRLLIMMLLFMVAGLLVGLVT
ncbi:MAG: hypothetical protein OXD01_12595 [Gammaproteobacteria bacterium]|nr:hypothetical protein [Gammaproteobacteria bacterium]